MKKIKVLFTAIFIFTMLFTFSFVSFAEDGISKKITLTCVGTSKTSVKLSWKCGYPYTSYIVYRAKESGKLKRVTEVTGKSYKDKGLETGSTYSYKVVGVYGKEKVSSAVKKVNPIKSVTASVYQGDKTHVTVTWTYPKKELSAIDGFYIYRKTEGEKSYTKIDKYSKEAYFVLFNKTYTYEYIDTSSKKAGKKYSYKVVPYKAKKKGVADVAEVTLNPYMYVAVKGKSATVKWSKVPGATEYTIYADIYKKNSDGQWMYKKTKNMATLSSKDKRTFTFDLNTSKYIYEIYLDACKYVGGEKIHIGYFYESTDSYEALLRGATVNSKLDKVKVINVRGEKAVTAWTEALSSKETKIFKDFEKLRFRKGMTVAEKIRYVLFWIHYNVEYDYDYDISGKYGYVESIFKYKQGQCIQYNGALIKYITYLGLPTRIIMGYRMGTVSHYWGEIKLDGRWYCMETGNYGKSGSWYNLCERYDTGASGYTFYGKTI